MDKIKYRNGLSIGVLFMIGSSVIKTTSYGHHSVQGLIVSFIIMLIVMFIYQNMLNKYHSLTLEEIIERKIGKVLTKILFFMYLLFIIYKASRSLFLFNSFVDAINQANTSIKTSLLFLSILLITYILKSGFKSMSKFFQFCFISAVLAIVILFMIGISEMDLTNILPIVPLYKNDFIKNTIIYCVRPFGEATFLYNIFSKIEDCKEKRTVFYRSQIISLLIMLIILIETIAILGDNFILVLSYPYFTAIACIDVLSFVARIEILSMVMFYMFTLTKVVILIYLASQTIDYLINIKDKTTINNNNYYCYLVVFVTILSLIIYDNTIDLKTNIFIYCVLSFIFILIIPFVINILKTKEIFVKDKT